MKFSRLPPVGIVLAVVSAVPPPRTKRLTMASPIPLVPPLTSIRLPVNSFASYGTLDALIVEPPRSHFCYDLSAKSLQQLDARNASRIFLRIWIIPEKAGLKA